MAVFKNPRERYQISVLSRQAYPNSPQKLVKAYEEATAKPHGYLFIDFKQDTPEKDRIVKNIFPNLSISPAEEQHQQQSVLQQSTKNISNPSNRVIYNATPQQLGAHLPTDIKVRLTQKQKDRGWMHQYMILTCLHVYIVE